MNARRSARLSSSSASVSSIALRVDLLQSVDQRIDVAVGVGAGDLEQRLRDRERGAQLVRGVRGEALLLGDVRLEPVEHRVEHVGEVAELVARPLQRDAVRERSLARRAARRAPMRSSGASIRPASNQPPARPIASSDEHDHDRDGHERAHQVGAVGHEDVGDDLHSGTYRSRNSPTAASSRPPDTTTMPA